jgi:hypothetical protein
LAAVVIGRPQCSSGLFACYESLLRMSRDVA